MLTRASNKTVDPEGSLAKTLQSQGGVAIKIERKVKSKGDTTRINHGIVAREVRVIGADGQQLGILSTQEAVKAAEERSLDLVEVSPLTRPPVCRIMDYGKYKYTQKKKQASAKKRAMNQALKEVKLRPKTEEHDYQFKLKHIIRFLLEGNKAKVTVRFRGREMAHRDIGMEMLHRIIRDVGDMATVASEPMMEGRLLQMVLTPSPKALAMFKQTRDEQRKETESSTAKEGGEDRNIEQSQLEGR